MSRMAAGAAGALDGRRRRVVLTAAAGGAVLHLVGGFFTVAAIGLYGMPLWAGVALAGAWLAAAAIVVSMVRRAPLAAVVAPLVHGALLWVAVTAGAAWGGWAP